MFHLYPGLWAPFDMSTNVFVIVLIDCFHEFFEFFIDLVDSEQKLSLTERIKIAAHLQELMEHWMPIG